MKTFIHLFFCWVLCGSGFAQLVHLRMDGTVVQQFGGQTWGNAGDLGSGSPATLHLYFDQKLAPDPDQPGVPARTYWPQNSANNFWRMQYAAVDVSAAFDYIQVTDGGLSVYFSDLQNGYTTLDLRLTFTQDPSPGFDLPKPPFPPLGLPTGPDLPWTTSQSSWAFDTGSGFGLDEGAIQVRVDRIQGEILRDFRPVPESTTFGVFAAALLVGAIALRRCLLVRKV